MKTNKNSELRARLPGESAVRALRRGIHPTDPKLNSGPPREELKKFAKAALAEVKRDHPDRYTEIKTAIEKLLETARLFEDAALLKSECGDKISEMAFIVADAAHKIRIEQFRKLMESL